MDDLISKGELRKAFKESGYFTGPSLHWARLLIDQAPTVERPHCPACGAYMIKEKEN